MLTFLKKLRRDERGVSGLEYAVLAAIIVGAIIVGAQLLKPSIDNAFTEVNKALNQTSGKQTKPLVRLLWRMQSALGRIVHEHARLRVLGVGY